jgi:D-galactarolactone isomerase
VDHSGFQALLRLIDGGRCWLKLSGAYMMSKSGPPLYEDIGVLAKALVAHAPERVALEKQLAASDVDPGDNAG